jgi:hypothetical protein
MDNNLPRCDGCNELTLETFTNIDSSPHKALCLYCFTQYWGTVPTDDDVVAIMSQRVDVTKLGNRKLARMMDGVKPKWAH